MTMLVEAPPCVCRHGYAEHITDVGCTHKVASNGDDLTCVCDGYAE
jgi:hypothetical protein